MLELIILCISAVANIILGLLVFANNSRNVVNRYFALFVVAFVSWTLINFISLHPVILPQLLLVRLALAAATLLSMFLLLLVNVFPNSVPTWRHLNRWTVIAGIIVMFLTLTPLIFSDLRYDTFGNASPIVGPAIPLFGLYAIGGLVLAITLLFYKYKHYKDLMKAQTGLALFGIALSFSLILFSNFVLVVFFGNTMLIPFAPAYSLIFTTIFAYIILRHHLFDIRLVVTRLLTYSLLLLAIGGLYGLGTVALSLVVTGVQINPTQIFISAVIVGVLVLLVQPLRSFFNRLTKSIFYQDAYESQKVLDDLSGLLVSTVNIEDVCQNAAELLRTAIKPQYVAILLQSEHKKNNPRIIVNGKNEIHQGAELFELLSSFSGDLIVQDESHRGDGKVMKGLRASNGVVAARLEAHGDFIGYIVFGVKNSGRPYTRQDIDLIHIVVDELALGIQNALRFEEIRQFNQTLQQRIDDATKELRKTNEQLQKLDAAKDEFVSMASHQLRTPLTSIKGYISMVLEGDVGKITPTQRQMLSEAFTSSERMVHLIGDFLNVSRLQTGKFMLEDKPVDLSKLVAQEIDSLQTTIEAHGLKLHYRKPSYFPVLMLDEGKIRQVLMNFIDNAIFYSPEGKTITVKLSVEEGFAVVRVIDAGIGVPKSEQAHLFTKFFRASNARKQRPDGTGVGLFLAKKVIAAHGGVMVFESEEGKGSTFGFRLPIKKLQASEKDIKTSAGNSAYQLKK